MFYVKKKLVGGEGGGHGCCLLPHPFNLMQLLLYAGIYLFWEADLEGLFSFVEVFYVEKKLEGGEGRGHDCCLFPHPFHLMQLLLSFH